MPASKQRARMLDGGGRAQITAIREALAGMIAAEEQLLAARKSELARQQARVGATLLVAGALVFLLLAAAFGRLLLENRRRLAAESRLLESNRELERRVAERTASLQRHIESLPVAYVTADVAWRFDYLNPAAERLLGYSSAELAGRPAIDTLFPAALRDAAATAHERWLADHADQPTMTRLVTRDGRQLYTEWHNRSVFDAQGRLEGAAAIVLDVTAREMALRALRESEARFRGYFELGVVGMAISAPDMRWIEVNPHFCDILGCTREELIGRSWVEFTHPEDVGPNTRMVERVLAGEIDGFTLDKRYLRRDGTVVEASIAAKCVRRGDGSVDHLVSMMQDMGARKRHERELQDAQRDYAELAAQIPVGTYKYRAGADGSGRFLYVSPRMCQILNVEAAAILADAEVAYAPIHPDDRASLAAEETRRRGDTGPLSWEGRAIVAGRVIWIAIESRGTPLADGSILRSGLLQDITERKQRERDLERARRDYEELSIHVPIGVYKYRMRADGSECFDYVSPRMCAMLGLDARAALADVRVPFAPIHPDDLPSLVAANAEVRRSRARFAWRGRAVVGGRTLWIELGSQAVESPDGDVIWNGYVRDISVEHAAESRLRESEARWRTLVDLIPLGVQECDPDGRITFANPAHERMHGTAPGQLIGRYVWQLDAEPQAQAALRAYLAHLVAEQPPPVPYVGRDQRDDGTVIDTQVDWTYRRDENGRLTGFVAVISDISERLRAEREKEALRKDIARILEGGMQAFVSVDRDWRYTYINARAAQTLGEPASLLGRSVWEVFPDAVGTPFHEAMLRAAASGQPVEVENYYAPMQTWFEIRIQPFADGVALFFNDISGRKRGEEELRQTRDLLQSIVEEAPIAIVVRDLHGRVQKWNRAAAEIFGWNEAEVLGTDPPTVGPEGEAAYRDVRRRALGGEGIRALDMLRRRRDGSVIAMQVGLAPLHDAQGQVIGTIGLGLDMSDKARAEDELRRSRALLRSVIEATPDAIFAKDLQGRYTLVNSAAARFLSLPREVAIGKNDFAVFPPEAAARFAEEDRRMLQDGCTSAYHMVLTQPDRGARELAVFKGPLTDEQGKVVGVFGVARDVTELRSARAALATSEARLALALEATNIGLWDWTIDQGEPYFSPTWKTMLGYTDDDLPSAYGTWIELLHPDDLAAAESAVTEELLHPAGSGRYDEQFRLRGKSGEWRWINSRGRLVERFADGTPRRAIGVQIDITGQKRAEQALIESESRWRRVVDAMPVLFDALDETGCIVAWNAEAERVSGYAAAEVIGNPRAMELLYPDAAYRTRMLEEMERRGSRYRDWEWSLTTRQGAERVIAWSNLSHATQVPGWASWGIGIDVTDRRQAESALRRSAERLSELSRQVLHLQEEERGALARELHDEIGQQLGALKLNLGAMQRSIADATLRLRVADCIEIVETALQQIRDRALDLRPSVLDDLGLGAALDWYGQRQAQRSGCRIEVDARLGRELPDDVATAAFRIVQEAVMNALRHAHCDRIVVALNLDAGHLVVTIADNGRGFVTAERQSGFGIGSMSERARLLGGRLELSTAPGCGTRIVATLPVEEEA